MGTLKPPNEDDDFMGDSDSEDDEANEMEAFRDELSQQYLAYTHCTVVEFTQDEGHVGIPQIVAKALLGRKSDSDDSTESKNLPIPVKRTVDPAASATNADGTSDVVSPGDQTPGHLAWGGFD